VSLLDDGGALRRRARARVAVCAAHQDHDPFAGAGAIGAGHERRQGVAPPARRSGGTRQIALASRIASSVTVTAVPTCSRATRGRCRRPAGAQRIRRDAATSTETGSLASRALPRHGGPGSTATTATSLANQAAIRRRPPPHAHHHRVGVGHLPESSRPIVPGRPPPRADRRMHPDGAGRFLSRGGGLGRIVVVALHHADVGAWPHPVDLGTGRWRHEDLARWPSSRGVTHREAEVPAARRHHAALAHLGREHAVERPRGLNDRHLEQLELQESGASMPKVPACTQHGPTHVGRDALSGVPIGCGTGSTRCPSSSMLSQRQRPRPAPGPGTPGSPARPAGPRFPIFAQPVVVPGSASAHVVARSSVSPGWTASRSHQVRTCPSDRKADGASGETMLVHHLDAGTR
jgi:hypothetical protein